MAKSVPVNEKQLVALVDGIETAVTDLREHVARGVFNDKEQKKEQALQKKIGDLKQALAEKLSGNPTGNTVSISPGRRKAQANTVNITDEKVRERLETFFVDLVQDSDNKPGNLPLLRALLHFVALDFPALCESHGLLTTCAVDGSMGYLGAFFSEPQNLTMRFDTVELITAAMYNQQYRIPLMTLLLKYGPHLKLEEVKDELAPLWLEFCSDVASKKKAIPREDRSGLQSLLEKMLRHPVIPVDASAEGPDGLTIFARACLEGDVPLMEMLISIQCVPPINRVNGDGLTALMEAVVSNVHQAVKLVSSLPGVDFAVEGKHGTALHMALTLKRDPVIVQLLEKRSGAVAPPPLVAQSATNAQGGGGSPGIATPLPPPTVTESTRAPAAVPPKRPVQLASLAGKMPVGAPSTKRNSTTEQPHRPAQPAAANATNVSGSSSKRVPAKLAKLPDLPTRSSDNGTSAESGAAPPARQGPARKLPELSSPQTTPRKAQESGSATPPQDKLGHHHLTTSGGGNSPGRSPAAPPLRGLASSNPRTALLPLEAPVVGSAHPHSSPSKPLSVSGTLPPFHLDSSLPKSRDDFDVVSPLAQPSTGRREPEPRSSPTTTKSPSRQRSHAGLKHASLDSSVSTEISDGTSATRISSMFATTTLDADHVQLLDTDNVMDLMQRAIAEKLANNRRASMGLFTEDELMKQDTTSAFVLNIKEAIANLLRSKYSEAAKLQPGSAEEVEVCTQFFVSCVEESDAEPANCDAAVTMLALVELDYVSTIRDNRLVEAASADGSVAFLEALLHVPGVQFDLAETVCCCMFNQTCRINLVYVLLQRLSRAHLESIRRDLWDEYNEFFADICSKKKQLPHEDRSRRLDLVAAMVSHRILALDPRHCADDQQTVLSRAAHEGDADLVRVLIRNKFVHAVNEMLPDGSTALIHAVYGNNVAILTEFLRMPGCDVNFSTPSSGSAYEVAKNLKRDGKILSLLQSYGGEDGVTSSPIFAVPQLKVLESSKLEASMSMLSPNKAIRKRTARSGARSDYDSLVDLFAD